MAVLQQLVICGTAVKAVVQMLPRCVAIAIVSTAQDLSQHDCTASEHVGGSVSLGGPLLSLGWID
jgi:ribosomal protein S8